AAAAAVVIKVRAYLHHVVRAAVVGVDEGAGHAAEGVISRVGDRERRIDLMNHSSPAVVAVQRRVVVGAGVGRGDSDIGSGQIGQPCQIEVVVGAEDLARAVD